jgi:[ribosomal protein S5]-alanine N-acetyltransferase
MFPRHVFPRLTTQRLLLREITPQDRDALLANYSDPEVGRWFLENPPTSADQVDKILREFISSYDRGTGITWAIVFPESGELLGTCGYERVEVGSEGEIGFDLAKACWGKGLMTEALAAILAFGFGHMDLERVVASTYSRNTRASRLLERLGFHGRPEGEDSWLFVLTEAEWARGAA